MPTRVAWRDDLPPAVPERPVHRADGRQRTLRLPADPLVVEVEVRPDPQRSPVDGHRQLCAAPVHGLPGHQGEMPQVLLIASRLHHPVELHRVRAVELNRCHRRCCPEPMVGVEGPSVPQTPALTAPPQSRRRSRSFLPRPAGRRRCRRPRSRRGRARRSLGPSRPTRRRRRSSVQRSGSASGRLPHFTPPRAFGCDQPTGVQHRSSTLGSIRCRSTLVGRSLLGDCQHTREDRTHRPLQNRKCRTFPQLPQPPSLHTLAVHRSAGSPQSREWQPGRC